MKLFKLLLVSLALVSGTTYAAGYADLQYYQEENRNTHNENIKHAVTVGNKTEEGWDYSLKLETSQTELGNGSIGEGVEVRVRKGLSMGVLKPYIGLRLGEKISSSAHFSHYAIDAGTKCPLFGGLTGDIGYRYRNAFETSNDYQSNRYHAALSYDLTKNDSVAVRYSQAYGDSAEEKNSWRFTYSRKF